MPHLPCLANLKGEVKHRAHLIGKLDLVDGDVAARSRAGKFRQHRLWIEQVHLARAAVLEQVDHGLGLGWKMWRTRL